MEKNVSRESLEAKKLALLRILQILLEHSDEEHPLKQETIASLWERWKCYVTTNGHGNDVDLKQMISMDSNYAEKHFQFSLVEYFFNTDKNRNNERIIEREKFWKEVLQTKKYGYNNN